MALYRAVIKYKDKGSIYWKQKSLFVDATDITKAGNKLKSIYSKDTEARLVSLHRA